MRNYDSVSRVSRRQPRGRHQGRSESALGRRTTYDGVECSNLKLLKQDGAGVVAEKRCVGGEFGRLNSSGQEAVPVRWEAEPSKLYTTSPQPHSTAWPSEDLFESQISSMLKSIMSCRVYRHVPLGSKNMRRNSSIQGDRTSGLPFSEPPALSEARL